MIKVLSFKKCDLGNHILNWTITFFSLWIWQCSVNWYLSKKPWLRYTTAGLVLCNRRCSSSYFRRSNSAIISAGDLVLVIIYNKDTIRVQWQTANQIEILINHYRYCILLLFKFCKILSGEVTVLKILFINHVQNYSVISSREFIKD